MFLSLYATSEPLHPEVNFQFAPFSFNTPRASNFLLHEKIVPSILTETPPNTSNLFYILGKKIPSF